MFKKTSIMRALGFKCVAVTWIDGKCDVGPTVTGEIEEHANNTGLVDEVRGEMAQEITGQ